MKIATIALLALLFVGCTENMSEDPEPMDPEVKMETNNGKVTLKGDFKGASGHTTTGSAQITKSEEGKLFLELVNFKTDNGPDLRLYLAENENAQNFVEISNKVENGSKSYALGNNVDLQKQKTVLIWCKAFSVNFGFATLKDL